MLLYKKKNIISKKFSCIILVSIYLLATSMSCSHNKFIKSINIEKIQMLQKGDSISIHLKDVCVL